MVSHVNLNNIDLCGQMLLMQYNFNLRYYVNYLISEYISCDLKSMLVINGTKISSMVFLYFLINISQAYQISTIQTEYELSIQKKCNNMFQIRSWIIYFNFLVTYLVYIFYIILCGNYPPNLKRRRR